MTILSLLVWIMIAGVLVYVVNAVVPMDAKFKVVLNAVIAIVLILWVAEALGLIGPWSLHDAVGHRRGTL